MTSSNLANVPVASLIHGFYWTNPVSIATADYDFTLATQSAEVILFAELEYDALDCKSGGFLIESMEYDADFGVATFVWGANASTNNKVYALVSYVDKKLKSINYGF